MKEFIHDNLRYYIDESGNISSMSASYKKENREYLVSFSIEQENMTSIQHHIKLEITKRSRNPLKNIFGDKLLAYSKTPLDCFIDTIWVEIRFGKLKYPEDERFHGLINLALKDIKEKSSKIETDISYMCAMQKQSKKEYEAYKREKEAKVQAILRQKHQKDAVLINEIVNRR